MKVFQLVCIIVLLLSVFLYLSVYSFPVRIWKCPNDCDCDGTVVDCTGRTNIKEFPDLSFSPFEEYLFLDTGIRYLNCSHLGRAVRVLNVEKTGLEFDNLCELATRCGRLKDATFTFPTDFEPSDCIVLKHRQVGGVYASSFAATTPYHSETDTVQIKWSMVTVPERGQANGIYDPSFAATTPYPSKVDTDTGAGWCWSSIGWVFSLPCSILMALFLNYRYRRQIRAEFRKQIRIMFGQQEAEWANDNEGVEEVVDDGGNNGMDAVNDDDGGNNGMDAVNDDDGSGNNGAVIYYNSDVDGDNEVC